MLEVSPVNVRDEGVTGLIDALTVELADEGYTDEESFGYSADQLEESGVHLVGAFDARCSSVSVGSRSRRTASPSSSASTSTPRIVDAASLTR